MISDNRIIYFIYYNIFNIYKFLFILETKYIILIFININKNLFITILYVLLTIL